MSAKLSVVANYVPAPPQAEQWFTRDATGSLVFTGQTYNDHLQAWTAAQTAVNAGLWGQAMVAASLDTKYGSKAVEEFAADVRRHPSWIYDMARAYRVFQFSSQLENLSFTHHIQAAKAYDPQETLAKAFEKGWNCKELQDYVETGIEPQPKESPERKLKDEAIAEAMDQVHSQAIQEELLAKQSVLKEWPDSAITPLLAAVYRKCSAIIDWQKERTLERDCGAVMMVFSQEEGYTVPDCASFAYIHTWLGRRGWLMTKKELQHRIDTLKTLQILTDYSREGSRGSTQRGAVTPVYEPCAEYAKKMEEFAALVPLNRKIAMHLDWVQRIKTHAPELLPKAKAA